MSAHHLRPLATEYQARLPALCLGVSKHGTPASSIMFPAPIHLVRAIRPLSTALETARKGDPHALVDEFPRGARGLSADDQSAQLRRRQAGQVRLCGIAELREAAARPGTKCARPWAVLFCDLKDSTTRERWIGSAAQAKNATSAQGPLRSSVRRGKAKKVHRRRDNGRFGGGSAPAREDDASSGRAASCRRSGTARSNDLLKARFNILLANGPRDTGESSPSTTSGGPEARDRSALMRCAQNRLRRPMIYMARSHRLVRDAAQSGSRTIQ